MLKLNLYFHGIEGLWWTSVMFVEILDGTRAFGDNTLWQQSIPSNRTYNQIHLMDYVFSLCKLFFHMPITIPLIQMEKLHDEVKMKYCMNDSIIHDNDSVCL
jgi:hypothetical protein